MTIEHKPWENAAQAEVLGRLTDGTTINTRNGRTWQVWYSGTVGDWVNFYTFDLLRKRGWIKPLKEDRRGNAYGITQAGREALERLKEATA